MTSEHTSTHTKAPHTSCKYTAGGYICKLTADAPLMGQQRAVTTAQGVWSRVWQIISPALVVYRVVIIIIIAK